MDMDRLAIDNRTTRERATIQDTTFAQGRCRRNQSKVSDVASDLTVYPPHYSVGRITESCSSLGNRIEYRLELGRRARDHPQNVAGCGLLLRALANYLRLRRDRLLLRGDRLLQCRNRPSRRRGASLHRGFLRGLFNHLVKKKPGLGTVQSGSI